MNAIERTYDATIDELWDLWTTPAGIESWWGPEGFTVAVRALALRAGGALTYAMTATGEDQIEFMNGSGLPLVTETHITYTEVVPKIRLAYTTRADFVPNVEPYDVATVVEFAADGPAVRVKVTFDSMHDEHWTNMSRMGRESELDKLPAALSLLRGR